MIEGVWNNPFRAILGRFVNQDARRARTRLFSLDEHWQVQHQEKAQSSIDWSAAESNLQGVRGRLGRAGFFTPEVRGRAQLVLCFVLFGATGIAAAIGSTYSITSAIISGIAALYASLLGILYYLRHRESDVQRDVMFQLPLVLENLILLIEAGLGVLPALEQIVFSRINNAREQGVSPDLTTFLLKVVYDLSAYGMPFAEALERVAEATEVRPLRHVLLHLDISASEGGELIPSVRSLSDHAHTEWRLSVETRVNRLENMVVFPVFASVIGLMILTASVPLVPVLEFFESVKSQNNTQLNSAPIGASTSPIPLREVR